MKNGDCDFYSEGQIKSLMYLAKSHATMSVFFYYLKKKCLQTALCNFLQVFFAISVIFRNYHGDVDSSSLGEATD